jgi:hypothetical protein
MRQVNEENMNQYLLKWVIGLLLLVVVRKWSSYSAASAPEAVRIVCSVYVIDSTLAITMA